MSRKKVIFILTTIFFSMVFAMTGYCSEKPTCAVLLFHPDTASSNLHESQMISGQYAELLNRLDMFDVMDYNEAAAILKTKNAEDLDQACADLECALKVGNKLNADFVIYGISGNAGNMFSLDTTLVNVAGGNETQHAVYDYEGNQQVFQKTAAAENIKSLFGINEIPAPKALPPETKKTAAAKPSTAPPTVTTEEAPSQAPPKALSFGPRIGIGASNDGVQIGGGFEVQFTQLSFQLLLNTDGFASGLSYYLHQTGNSPFMSIVGSYYDTKNHGVDEIGRIYGVLLGYRITFDNYIDKEFAKNLNTRIGLGAGYVNWDQTELNRSGVEYNDKEFIPLFEISFGYMF